MDLLRKIIESRFAAVGLVVLGAILASAAFAPMLIPFDPAAQDVIHRLLPPFSRTPEGLHVLGTDALGRDILSRLFVATRVSIFVGVAAVIVSGLVGVALGLIAGYDDRRVGRAIMAVADVQLAVPFLILALAVAAVLGPSLFNLIGVLGVTNWVQFARIVRSEALTLREREFVQAAIALGAPAPRVIYRHLLPNVASSIIVISGLQIARMILFESSLSFLGLGVPAQIPTWGSMIADGRNYIGNAWWVSAVPGVAIFVTVISINLVGDRLRDVLDPKLQRLDP
jgi:peptide/nickel transport system permease protein